MLVASFCSRERRKSPSSMFATYGLGHFLDRDEAIDEYVETNFAFKLVNFFFLLPEKWSSAGSPMKEARIVSISATSNDTHDACNIFAP